MVLTLAEPLQITLMSPPETKPSSIQHTRIWFRFFRTDSELSPVAVFITDLKLSTDNPKEDVIVKKEAVCL
jgi:hypothetical protein